MAARIVVLGGGVGGLSAAQELAERGFEVTVYERRPDFGGKARSIPVPNSATPGRKPLPGEHGFRFFPSFYKHLPDTMKRIPFAGKSVFDNLVYSTRVEIARTGKTGLPRAHAISADLGRLVDRLQVALQQPGYTR